MTGKGAVSQGNGPLVNYVRFCYNQGQVRSRWKGTREMIEQLNEMILPPIIALLELIGIFVVTFSALHAFWEYLQTIFLHRSFDLKVELANGLATALEFKMAAEILKTVLVREMSELLTLGAVIALRALLSILIHFELRGEHGHPDTPNVKNEE